ncbi:Putative pre-16S rRNA nuclease [Koleobacter methoxysyntrophicus]|jgi:putative Holliday junction resolvase|uniref:Putative pre-16S rRNA nuclease n=1 Tax=Koleobacter methoxysyntrophicus TaxID=2751313 RepID=A0A8A0RRL0_9FIRM|nr:Holliday junction resolvase RuvX [Koleobacter methoxysyntrophicus]MDI3540684.1 putative pre6S rRNA nuclease [Thermosediminibacterales bacterium]QSQ10017.1 Putative pre-16S rRNA nuclease [Koleobacter methoxysyntrophicus]
MRVMALDVGDRNIGVAISDETGLVARGIGVIKRKSIEKDLQDIKNFIKENHVEKIVIGLPKNMNGTVGFQGSKVLNLVEKLKEVTSLPVITWDERLTTVMAERVLIQADMSRKKRKSIIDKMAAAIILQNYLDSQNNS